MSPRETNRRLLMRKLPGSIVGIAPMQTHASTVKATLGGGFHGHQGTNLVPIAQGAPPFSVNVHLLHTSNDASLLLTVQNLHDILHPISV